MIMILRMVYCHLQLLWIIDVLVATMYPMSRLVKSVVEEKESRMREVTMLHRTIYRFT